MKVYLTLFILLGITVFAQAQPVYVSQGGTRPIDSSRYRQHLIIDSAVRFSKYIDPSGSYVLATTANGSLQLISRLTLLTDTASLSNRINERLKYTDTATMLNSYLRKTDTATLSSRIDARVKYSDTANMLLPYLRNVDTINLSNQIQIRVKYADTSAMLLPYLRKADTTSLSNRINLKLSISDTASMLTPYVRQGRTINTTSPLSGGGNLSADRTIAIANAAADGSTKGAASFTSSDFDATSGNISIDYTNGQAATTSLKGFLTSTDWNTFNNKVATARSISTTYPLSGGGDLSADRTIVLDTANWHSYNFYKTVFHQQNGNAFGTTSIIGTTDAFGLSLRTNSVEHMSISSAGAVNFPVTTFDVAPTTGAFSISAAGQVGVTRGGTSENSLNVGLSGTTARLIMGVGNGVVSSSGRLYINFSQTGSPDNNSATITSNSGNLLFTNIGSQNQVSFSGTGSTTPIFTIGNTNTQPWKFAHIVHFQGGGLTTASDFMTLYYSPSLNSNITYTSGTTTFRTCIATPRINTSGSHTGNIEGFVYEPNEVAVAAGTVQIAFRANNTNGYGFYGAGASLTNYIGGKLLIGTATFVSTEKLRVSGDIVSVPTAYSSGTSLPLVSNSTNSGRMETMTAAQAKTLLGLSTAATTGSLNDLSLAVDTTSLTSFSPVIGHTYEFIGAGIATWPLPVLTGNADKLITLINASAFVLNITSNNGVSNDIFNTTLTNTVAIPAGGAVTFINIKTLHWKTY